MDELFIKHNKTDFDTVHLYEVVSTPSSEHGLKDPNVQKIIHSENLQFDLVINEEFFHESWLLFAYKFNAPVVTICEFFVQFSFIWLKNLFQVQFRLFI